MASTILKGLAVAAGTGLAIGFGYKRRSDSSDDILALEPLLDRLDRIEARMSAVEARPLPDVQAMLESVLGPHVEDVRARLHAEVCESVQTTLTAFEQALDDKVSLRIATLEKALIDQSAIVTTLSRRAVDAEANFQRLIAAVERPALDLHSGFRRSLLPTPLATL
jgi:hypothetical protein